MTLQHAGGEAPHDGKHNAAVTDEALLELQVAENEIFDIQKKHDAQCPRCRQVIHP